MDQWPRTHMLGAPQLPLAVLRGIGGHIQWYQGLGLKKYVRTIIWYHLFALVLSFLALCLCPLLKWGAWVWFLCHAGGWLQAEGVNPGAVPPLVLMRTVKSTPEPNFGEPPTFPHFYVQVNLRDPCCLNSILPGEENEWAH